MIRLALALSVPLALSCGDEKGKKKNPGDDTADSGETGDTDETGETGETGDTGPDEAFDRFCLGAAWDASTEEGALGDTHGAVVGSYTGLPEGTGEAMGFNPEHPFHVTTLRLKFDRGEGTARIRLMSDFGGSYADIENPDADLMEPIDLEVATEDLDLWMEVDVSDRDIFLLPYRPYFLVYEHLTSVPTLSLEEVAEGDIYRAAMWYDDQWYGVGDDSTWYNYSMELGGETFCTWDERWFTEETAAPWQETASPRVTIADVDGDRDDDVVLNAGGPLLYANDGAGTFTAVSDPWPEATYMSIMVFADLDNDGDVDAVGLSWDGADGDGDGYMGGVDNPDCNDADADVHPGAKEVTNGLDDDCDGIADDGTDTADDDADGTTEADGDCDDTRSDVFPGAAELNDARDNDCDLVTDEDFVNRVLLNDGTGQFTAVDCPDVEKSDPTGGGALGDADGDGVLDLYYGNWLKLYPNPPAVPDRYLVGDGSGCFTDAAAAAGITSATEEGALASYGVVWADYNNDGALDIFVSNYGYGHNLLFENLGDGTFQEVGERRGASHDAGGSGAYADQGGNTFGADWGDIDNDGDLDLIATNIAHPRYQPWSDITQLLRNKGSPNYGFEDVREELGLAYDEGDVNASFADYDNDGDLDLVVSSLYTGHYSRLYRNDGDAFTDVTYEAGLHVHDAVSNAWLDIEGDGDLDLVIADRTGAPYVHLFENEAAGDNHWVELVLEGGPSNRSAVGARVTIEAGGVRQIREIKGGGGHSGNQSTLTVHFGLGATTAIDALEVRWPGGAAEEFTGVAADGRYILVEGAGTATGG